MWYILVGSVLFLILIELYDRWVWPKPKEKPLIVPPDPNVVSQLDVLNDQLTRALVTNIELRKYIVKYSELFEKAIKQRDELLARVHNYEKKRLYAMIVPSKKIN